MNNIKKTLTYFNKGSFGYIFYDIFNNIYKITKLTDYDVHDNKIYNILERNNIIELIMLNYFINDNIEKENITLDDNLLEKNNELIEDYKINSYNDYHNLLQSNRTLVFKKKEIRNYFNFLNFSSNKYKNGDNYIIVNTFYKFSSVTINSYFNIKKIINDFKNFSEQLLIAVATLHHNGFLHGDISTNNIMINNDKLVLIDLGGIKLINYKHYFNTCTLTYRSPEDLQANILQNLNKNNNVKSDLWSIGIFLSEIILGYSITNNLYNNLIKMNISNNLLEKKILEYYDSKINIEIEKKILKCMNDAYIDIDNENCKELLRLCRITEKLLIINPDNRFSSVEEVYKEIFNKNFEYNFKKIYTYQNDFINNEKFFNFRKNYYCNTISISIIFNNNLIIPFLINLLDRFFNQLLKNNIDIYNFDLNKLESISLASICLSSLFIIHDDINITKLVINSSSINTNIYDVQKYIIYIILTLNYDIYRPYNIINNVDNFEDNLEEIYYNIIINNIIDATPEYYIDQFKVL